MTRYLARDILNKCNINNFDDWAANFAEPVTRMEYATDGVTIKPKTALANYVNVPELQSIWSQFADVMMQDEAEEAGYITLPKAVRKDLLVKVTPAQEPLLQSIAERGELLSLPTSSQKSRDHGLHLAWKQTHILLVACDGRGLYQGNSSPGRPQDDQHVGPL